MDERTRTIVRKSKNANSLPLAAVCARQCSLFAPYDCVYTKRTKVLQLWLLLASLLPLCARE